ncbi:MAG: amino acid adenylation domain-containing protein [Eubacteriales bacterium]
MRTNILEYLEQTAARLPGKLAFSDGKDGVSFGELYSGARSIGSFLAEKNCRRRSVAVLMDKHPHAIVTFMGIIYSGAYYVALDAQMPEVRMQMIIDTVDPACVITDEKHRAAAEKLGREVLIYSEIVSHPENAALLEEIREGQIDTDPIYVVFTSGSTGVPKGVAACHRSVIDYTEALCEAIGFDENTVFGNQTPLYFDAPLKEIMPTLKFGATTYLIPKQLFMFPVKLCEYLNEHLVNTICWVVSALTMISSLGVLDKTPPRYLSTVCFGSEVFPKNQYALWRKALPDARFFNLYGPTEATGMSCYWPATRSLGENEPIPVGKPFKNTDIFLIKEDGKEAAHGEVGEIYIRGTCVTLGYISNPEKTAEAFVQNPLNDKYPELVYRTGDLGRFNSYGELEFVSRKDSQIKHMGHRIELGEIEAAASTCDGVRRVCAVYPAEKKKIVLYYVGEVTSAELTAYLLKLVPRYMIPGEYRKLDAMPLTANCKINRKFLLDEANK